MYNLIIAALSAAATYGGFNFLLTPVEAIFPALVVFVAVYILLARRSGKTLEKVMLSVATDLQSARVEIAVKKLEEARKIGKWQFLINSQIDGHVGSILYSQKKFSEAKPYLENAIVRHWLARGMLGAQLYREKDFDKMKKVFDEAVKVNKGEGLLWNLYAWCLWKSGDEKAAMDVLTRAAKAIPSDEKVQANLKHIQNGKKVKMKAYQEQWFQFHLEPPPVRTTTQLQGPMGGMKFKKRLFR